MACLDTTLLLDLRGRGGRRLRERARRKVLDLASAHEQLTTTIFNLAELWVGIERAEDPEAEQVAVETVGPVLLQSAGICPSCQKKRAMVWAEGMVEEVLPQVPCRG